MQAWINAAQQMNVAFQNLGTAITQTASTINTQLLPIINSTYATYANYGTGYAAGTGNIVSVTDWWQTDLDGRTYYNGAALTPEAQAARERRYRSERKMQRAAAKRGAKLLLRLLDDRQQRDYAATRAFTMVSADGRIFRLRKGRTAELLDAQGNLLASFCIHLNGGFIGEDSLIAQKMMLDTDPAEFDRIANISWHRRPVPQPNVVPLRRAA